MSLIERMSRIERMSLIERRSLMKRIAPLVVGLASLTLFLTPTPAQRGLTINLGTVVPKGSAWHETLEQMSQDWARISDGRVRMRIFAGGALGDDIEMLRLVRIGRLQALAVTGIGLARIDEGIDALHIPMLFESYEELDAVRDRMAPTLERRMAAKGFISLNWSDGGWAHFFSKQPVRTLDDLRKQKLWISAGDPKWERLYKKYALRIMPLSLGDMQTGLQTGLVNAVTEPPLFAMLDGTYKSAPHMLDLRWAPVIGGTVISKDAWEKIPATLRPKLLEASRSAGQELRTKIRRLGSDAIRQMKSRGLTVIEADRQAWLDEIVPLYPRLRGDLAPADLFDQAIRYRDEYRAKSRSGATR